MELNFFEHLWKAIARMAALQDDLPNQNNVLLLLLVPPPLGSRLKVTKTKQTVRCDLIRSTTKSQVIHLLVLELRESCEHRARTRDSRNSLEVMKF